MLKRISQTIAFTLVFYFVFISFIENDNNASQAGPQNNKDIEHKETEIFPLEVGNVWNYEGIIKWTPINSNEVKEESIEWQTEVIYVAKSQNQKIAILEGYPADLIWSENGQETEKQQTLIIQDHYDYYHINSPETINWTLGNEIQIDFETQASQLFTWPVDENQNIKAHFDLERQIQQDSAYNLANLENYQYSYIKPSYKITLSTNPDKEIIEFSPTVGITHYEYKHFGTVMEVSLDLVEIY